jgi:hypothetical protein
MTVAPRVACAKCGRVNGPSVLSCERCGTPIPGRTLTTGRLERDPMIYRARTFYWHRPHMAIDLDRVFTIPIFLFFGGSALWIAVTVGQVALSPTDVSPVLEVTLPVALVTLGIGWGFPRGRSRFRTFWVTGLVLPSLVLEIGAAGTVSGGNWLGFWVVGLATLALATYLLYWWFRWSFLPPKRAYPVVRSNP